MSAISGSKGAATLKPLTSLRFFAAFFIFVYHVLGKFGLPKAAELGVFFGVGVPFFFALSGFILTYNYRPVFSVSAIAQMIGYRIARIWPLHLACLVLFWLSVGNPASPLQSLDLLLPNVLMIHSWFGSMRSAFSFNAVSWSLSVELAFYILFPLLLLCRSGTLVAVSIVSAGIGLIWATANWNVSPSITAPGISGRAIVLTHPLTALPIFIAGMLAARMHDRLLRVSPGMAMGTVLEIASLGLFVGYMLFNREAGAVVSGLVGANAAVQRWMHLGLGIVAFIPCIQILALQKGYVSRLLSVKPLVYLGEISFAIYLCHQFVQNSLRANLTLGPLEGFSLSLVCTLALSALLYRLVERPGQSLLRGLVDRACGAVVARRAVSAA